MYLSYIDMYMYFHSLFTGLNEYLFQKFTHDLFQKIHWLLTSPKYSSIDNNGGNGGF